MQGISFRVSSAGCRLSSAACKVPQAQSTAGPSPPGQPPGAGLFGHRSPLNTGRLDPCCLGPPTSKSTSASLEHIFIMSPPSSPSLFPLPSSPPSSLLPSSLLPPSPSYPPSFLFPLLPDSSRLPPPSYILGGGKGEQRVQKNQKGRGQHAH